MIRPLRERVVGRGNRKKRDWTVASVVVDTVVPLVMEPVVVETVAPIVTDLPAPMIEKLARPSDFSFSRVEIARIESLTGQPFTWDACCNNSGSNSVCLAGFSSPLDSFLNKDCTGLHVWINAPFKKLDAILAHYVACKVKAPESTSACIVVPRWTGGSSWRKHLHGMRLLHEYAPGTALFSTLASSALGPWPDKLACALQVWYDPPCHVTLPPPPLPLPGTLAVA